MLRQYLELKDQAGSALLLYRMGDFYELFFEDAQIAAPVLGITLTKRNHNQETAAPMCGIPHHAFDGYIGKLLAEGFRVAVAEQVEDPKLAKGLVRREIVRVHTPGTISDPDLLEGDERCFLVAIGGDQERALGAWIELSTGTFEGLDGSPEELSEQLARLRPREVLHAEGFEGWRRWWPPGLAQPTAVPLEPGELSPSAGKRRLQDQLGVASVAGFGLEEGEPLLGLVGALLGYVELTQRSSLEHLSSFSRHSPAGRLLVDRQSLANLEVESAADGGSHGSLLQVLDHTVSRMGKRLLREWLITPSAELDEIRDRHRAVTELVDSARLGASVREVLGALPDLERLASRIGLGQATPRELAALRDGLIVLPALKSALIGARATRLEELREALDPVEEARALLESTLADEPPAVLGAGVIRSGAKAELDGHRELASGGRERLAGIELAEREATGIKALKIKYNKVFGYFIEVSRANSALVPEHYERRQTLVNAERYIIPELKELESAILSAQDLAMALEKQMYAELIEALKPFARRLGASARAAAAIDVLACFANRARLVSYCRPEIGLDRDLEIVAGRHPVLEQLQSDPPFIANDCSLQPDQRQIVLLTGPNMGGKSTYLRQVALIALMAQAGSFVPAESAKIGLLERIFTRVGASDRLARGESTFMVEMVETANILNHAGARSLVILDEVGRGTATFDGLSLAWAIVEHLHESSGGAKVLFATHYHELTELSRRLERLDNASMAVKEWGKTILFLHRVVEGSADHSYGIHVARLAGVPDSVCVRAEEVLSQLEATTPALDPAAVAGPADEPESPLQPADQMRLFRPSAEEICELLASVELEHMTPIAAMALLAELKEKIDRGW